MVHAFIIIDWDKRDVVFSSLYAFETEKNSGSESFLSETNERIQKELRYKISVLRADEKVKLLDGDSPKGEATGILCHSYGRTEKTLVWRMYDTLVYVLVCDKSENRLLAARSLMLLVQVINELVLKNSGLSLASEITARPDLLTAIVNSYIPSGQLLFMNSRVLQQLKKTVKKLG